VSQPCDLCASTDLPGKLDASLGEFWVGSPWQIVNGGHNLSCFESKRAYLNVKGQDFLDISHLTGADNDGDGRSVVAADFRNCGKMDLIVRQAGGWPLLLYENRLPRKHYLKVSLRGRESNRQGIGSRLTAVVNGQQIVRELFPANSFYSQTPNLVHFGLSDSEMIECLTIKWPSGKVQTLKNLKADRHIIVDENGDDSVKTVVPGERTEP
jgi:hypothetical protein